ncbi:hypothetical protein Hypma_007777 [Hypsizygus marmoreus]|uniref:Uncharacterized protein n=1 Tax=Hypsizygus marmoreus TaxID=39966 RepID=A0A369JRE1_HYPMA|nr:hypothetical protein Hypma_007777 [Hypsizygus marmoreus]
MNTKPIVHLTDLMARSGRDDIDSLPISESSTDRPARQSATPKVREPVQKPRPQPSMASSHPVSRSAGGTVYLDSRSTPIYSAA